jgi:nucleotide-binding universal stress UspA family protein
MSLVDAVNRAKELGAQVYGSMEDGHAAERILNLADSDGSDLIVLAEEGFPGLKGS